jgi:hypothetical protein
MSEATQTLPDFLRSAVTPRFRDMVNKADQKLAQARREVDDLRSAQGSIAWEVGEGASSRWFINLTDGEITVSETAAHEPFMTVALSESDWERFVKGAAAGGLFAGNDRSFGKSRIERVRAIKGLMRFILTGLSEGGDFVVDLHFGAERAAEPKATVQMPAEVAAKLQSGTLNPQAAFMQGQMRLIGDMGFAMQLGMALAL